MRPETLPICQDIREAAIVCAVPWATASMMGSSISAGYPFDTRSVFMAAISWAAVTFAWGAAF